MKDLVVVDPKTGQRVNCGVIAKKRTIGDTLVYLMYDEPSRFWWIVWKEDRLRKIGFAEDRREDCWKTFFGMTEIDLAKLRSQ